MKYYLAPLEGITTYIYRRAYHKHFAPMDKYFTPFLVPHTKKGFSMKEKNDVMPEHSPGMNLVPQIMSNQAESFLHTVEKLKVYGYEEVNLNLGCPSKTVVSKGRGSGFLADPDGLDRFLDEIFKKCDVKISIKTRIGKDDPEEFARLLDIYNQYPVEELIIHPRVQKDFYKNIPNLEIFGEALAISKNSVCYNGDIFSTDDFKRIHAQFPNVECFMMGRGILADPSLAREIRGGKAADQLDIRRFHDLLYHTYREEVSGDRNVLFKMKEIWFYLAPMFADSKKYAKKIKKSERCVAYESAVNELFANCRFTGTQSK